VNRVEGGEGREAGAVQGGGIEAAAAQLGVQAGGGGPAGQRQQQRVENQQGAPFAQPDMQAGNRLDEHQLEGVVVGLFRDGRAAGPEGDEGKQEAGDAQGIGELQADEAFGRAVVADGQRQQEGGGQQQRQQRQHHARAQGLAQGEQGDGGHRVHGDGGESEAARAARRSTSWRSL
jgi:hypothetical protein